MNEIKHGQFGTLTSRDIATLRGETREFIRNNKPKLGGTVSD